MARQYDIQTPDGKMIRVEGPDDATDEELIQFARSQVGDQYQSNPVEVERNDERPTSFAQGVAEGAANVWNHAADWLEGGLEQIGVADEVNALGSALGFAPNVEQAVINQQRLSASSPYQGSTAGRVVGEIGAQAPLAGLPGGPLLQGALGGALMSNEGSVSGVLKDAAIGGAVGKVGDVALRKAADLASPFVEDGLRSLVSAGVRVTPGQTARAGNGLGSRIASTIEDRATSLPFVGDAIQAGRARSVETFNTAAINRALEPIGEALPKDTPFGRRAIRYAGDQLSKAYDEILPTLRVSGDQQFADDLVAIHAETKGMAPGRIRQFNNILADLSDRYFVNGTEVSGEAMKEIETRLGEKIRRYARSQDADQQELGDALSSVLDALRETAARQNPASAQRLRAINQGWKSLTQVERAALNSKGVFGPSAYSQAVRRSSDTVRSRGYARGEALNQDLADAASDILPSEVPDSGTAGRWAQSNLIALGLGAVGTVPYALARAGNRAMLRESFTSPELARLLEYGARAAPVAAPGLVQAYSNAPP